MPDSGLAPGMNVYGPVSPFILQDLRQGTMCMPRGDDDTPALNLLDCDLVPGIKSAVLGIAKVKISKILLTKI